MPGVFPVVLGGKSDAMGWVALLESVFALHRVGVPVSMALEQQACLVMGTGIGSGNALARAWLRLRVRDGDPAAALRALASRTSSPKERFALEALTICMERPHADHHQVLGVALEQLRREASRRRGPRRREPQRIALLMLAAPVLVAALRLALIGA